MNFVCEETLENKFEHNLTPSCSTNLYTAPHLKAMLLSVFWKQPGEQTNTFN